MLRKDYNNFVRPTSSGITVSNAISGDEAKKLYLEEVNQVLRNKNPISLHEKDDVNIKKTSINKHKRKFDDVDVSNLKLFTSVQNNDINTLNHILDVCPDKISAVDEYGWSLLMIACQANSQDVVKELLKHGVDTTVQDKAGNSAQSLVIRNKNSHLADLLLSHVSNDNHIKSDIKTQTVAKHKTRHKDYICDICNHKTFTSKKDHLSSTLHNINASKGKKIPTNYVIPQCNKGYQIMLKTGWDRETGLGPDGSGKKYPIKAVPKYDKMGLGHEKNKVKLVKDELPKQHLNKQWQSAKEKNRRIEINFRREFY
ncbi:G patch domain and ankyrin repeat-containing protein 1 homolog [Bicyclus anynana]|uniref:G patch domain and ankyrin repeat-containing protein 1 homolog n=1 Tax=Bicyclus anynana TaxID=110368 RepID=A0A6J1NB44_BICAN|nr:G patch domain and ankyrin repeat-containing protein 1 homolog [Bicyclus anynana]